MCDIKAFETEEPFDFLVSNPPYIESKVLDSLARQVRSYESREALDGGEDGLDLARVIFEKSSRLLKPGGVVFLELGDQHARQALA